MESNDKNAIKSGFWYIVANFVTRGISFITMPIFTRLMTTDEIGQFVNLTTWIGLLAPALTLNLDSSVPVAKFEYKEKIDGYISSILILGSIVTAFCYTISIFFNKSILNVLKFDSVQFHILFLYLLSSPALTILQIKSRLDYKYKLSTILSLTSAGLFSIISLFVVTVSTDKLLGRELGLYIPTVILNVAIYIFFLNKSRSIKIEYWRYASIISIPLVFHALSGSLLSSFDRIMINSFEGSSATALYSVAYTCASIVNILWYSINQAWAPWAYEQMDKKNGTLLKKASKIYMILFGLIVLCFMLMAPEILWILGGSVYQEALNVIPPVMCGFVYLLVYSLYVNIETLEKKTVYVAIGTITASSINILLNYIFIPRFGYVAASYTTFVGYVILFIMHFLFVKGIGKDYWYDSKFNIGFLVVFTLISGLILTTYRYRILRYTIMIFMVLGISIKLAQNRKALNEAIRTKSVGNMIKVIVDIFSATSNIIVR